MLITAAVLETIGAPLRIMELETPVLKRGQVLVKILYSGLCRSQLMEVSGGRGTDRWLPHLLGHEGSGVVEAVGSGVSKVRKGDPVILTWIKAEGLDAPGASYRCGNIRINAGPVTTLNNYAVVAENRLVIKPAALDFATAVLYGCALPTGAGMALNELAITPEASVVVIGLGGIGISALMALLALNVRLLIAVDVAPEKLAAARSWGVRHCFSGGDDDVVEKVCSITGGGADYCIEAGGTVTSIEQGFAMIRKGGGKLLFASHPPETDRIQLRPHDLISGKQIAGSWGGAVKPDRDIPLFCELFSQAEAPLDSLLTQRYSLQNVNDALWDLEQGKVFRPLIVMQHDRNPGMETS